MRSDGRRHWTYESVHGEFKKEMEAYIKGKHTDEEIERYAYKLHYDEFRDLLHPSVVDPYTINFEAVEAAKAKELSDYLSALLKKRKKNGN